MTYCLDRLLKGFLPNVEIGNSYSCLMQLYRQPSAISDLGSKAAGEKAEYEGRDILPWTRPIFSIPEANKRWFRMIALTAFYGLQKRE